MVRPSLRPLLSFFVLAFLIAWGCWIPALRVRSVPHVLALVGLFGPAIAAVIILGSEGVPDLVARVRRWRFPLRWYLVAVLLMPIVYAAAVVLDQKIFGTDLRRIWIAGSPAFLMASLGWLLIVTSGEEIGWRGFALPELLRLGLSPLRASLVLGVVWGLWHLPFYWPGGETGIPYPLFLALTLGQSLIYTALYLRSRGSVLPAILLHATTDFGARLYSIDRFTVTTWALIDTMVLVMGSYLLWSSLRTPAVRMELSDVAADEMPAPS